MRLSIAVLITTAIAAPVVVPSAVEAAPEPTVRTGVPPIELPKGWFQQSLCPALQLIICPVLNLIVGS